MRVFKALEFSTVLAELTSHQAHCSVHAKAITALPGKEWIDSITINLERLETLCRAIDLKTSETKAFLTREHILQNRETVNFSALATDLRNVTEVLAVDVEKRMFVSINEHYSIFINSNAAFGGDVSWSFPSALPDIQEAGNCLAVECGTAAVFHLMRAVEWGLRSLCKHVGVTRTRKSNKPGKKKYVALDYSQWEKLLDAARIRIDAKISKLKPGKAKQELQEFYYPMLQDFQGFKDAWRNHVMHTRQTYSVKDAEAVMEHVKRFMVRLGAKVEE